MTFTLGMVAIDFVLMEH